MDLLFIWHNYRYWSKILFRTYSAEWPRGQGLRVGIFMFKLYLKVLKILYLLSNFLDHTIHLVYIWYTDSYGRCCSSKNISSTMSSSLPEEAQPPFCPGRSHSSVVRHPSVSESSLLAANCWLSRMTVGFFKTKRKRKKKKECKKFLRWKAGVPLCNWMQFTWKRET